MAGVVTMTSVIEDFETLVPCKKSCKDGDSPVVKTITNYFAPLPKSVEKTLPTPRPNNIMDYFSRKPGSSTERTSTPEQAVDNCLRLSGNSQTGEKCTTPERALALHVKPSRRRRLGKAARRLQKPEAGGSAEQDAAVVVVEDLDKGQGSVRESVSSCSILGSDTAALLMQLSAEAGLENSTETASLREAKTYEPHREDGKTVTQAKGKRPNPSIEPEQDCSSVSPIETLKTKGKRPKPSTEPEQDCSSVSPIATLKAKEKRPKPSTEPEQDCSSVSPIETLKTKGKRPKPSTQPEQDCSSVSPIETLKTKGKRPKPSTEPEQDCSSVSPIETLKAKGKRLKPASKQSRKRQAQETNQPDPELMEAEQSLCDVSMEVNVDEASQVNTSTITISFEEFLQSQSQGENESQEEENRDGSKAEDKDLVKGDEELSPGELQLQDVSQRTLTFQADVHTSSRQEACKPLRNLASIFTKRKEATSPAQMASPPPSQQKHELPVVSTKWKSNVVLQEQDLELAVVESESTPKCSQTERKQFMAAFKQPGLDGPRAKPVKAQAKQKALTEKTLESGDKSFEEDVIIVPSVEQPCDSVPEKKAVKKKLSRKGKKKSQKQDVVIPPATAASQDKPGRLNDEEAVATEEPGTTPATSISTVRRSKREAVLRKSPEVIESPFQKIRSQETALSRDSPLQMSTPKTRKSKRTVFKSELTCPADKIESPIRMKFTRVNQNVSISEDGNKFEILSPLATKTLRASVRRKQAKKLVEKAKVIQQSKKEDNITLRRSSRSRALLKLSYCEDEDSVICLERDQSPAQLATEGTTQKSLRSLNDVLGKTAPTSRDTKASPVGNVAQVLEKKAQRTSTVVSIFDESSREGSENSQDEEQFRARREFLKSGLPESFRKQIARSVATKEAYATSCSSFQPVLHVLQPPQGCLLWSLPWPDSPFLCKVKDLSVPSANHLASPNGSLCIETKPAPRAFCHRGSGSRKALLEGVRDLLVKEVSAANPTFPVQRFLTRFLKRRADVLLQCTALETEAVSNASSGPVSAMQLGVKRKRVDQEEVSGKQAKKRRSSPAEETTSASPEPTKRRGRLRRKRKLEEEEKKEKAKLVERGKSKEGTPMASHDDAVLVIDDSLLEGKSANKDIVMEDILWTEKYQPQHSSDIIGNTSSVRRLHSWLKEWKLCADREERKKQTEKKHKEGSNDSDWDCGEDTLDGEDFLCNTLLITGPTGVGKTAAVYACAQELGFKVFEVNSSSQRSGRLILSQLKEATQSHQVDIQGANALKPTCFNSYSSAGSSRPGSSPRRVNSPRRVVSSPRKHPQSPRLAKKGTLAPTSLASFFKVGRPPNKDVANTGRSQNTVVPTKKISKGTKEVASTSKEHALKTSPVTINSKDDLCEEQSKRTATSLILFEEVDVIFDDDYGFLAAIKTFMTTTKRPVILTTSDPTFSTMFDGNFGELHFHMPSVLNASSYLQLLCLAEDVRTDSQDLNALLRHNSCDIRQSILQLQFWTRSTGGRQITKLSLHCDSASNAEVKPETPAEDMSACALTIPAPLPACDSGCTESLLGLLNYEPGGDMQALFKGRCQENRAVRWEILTDSRRRGVSLLYSNMEALLPLPVSELTIPAPKQQPCAIPWKPPSALPSRVNPPPGAQDSASDDGSPVKVSSRMRQSKKLHCSSERDPFRSDSDSEDDFLSLCKPRSVPCVSEDKEEEGAGARTSPAPTAGKQPPTAPGRPRREPLTAEQRLKSGPVSRCLVSMANFLENMSFLDSHAHLPSPAVAPNDARPSALLRPHSAPLRDGMVDEPRAEPAAWAQGERELEIQAAVEALSFQQCREGVSQALEEAQMLGGELGREALEELTLPVAPHRRHFSLSSASLCQPELQRRRRELMEDLLSQGALGAPGNRPAAALDYLPTLRTICRSEQLKEQGKVKRRFLHYLDSIHLGLPKSTLQHLSEDLS